MGNRSVQETTEKIITPSETIYKTTQTTTPTPTSPQPINVVSGRQDIETCQKNLFDKNTPNICNIYFSNANLLIAYTPVKSVYIKCKPNTTYTVSKIQSQRFAVGSLTQLVINTEATNKIQNNSATSITLTTGANDKYLLVFYYLLQIRAKRLSVWQPKKRVFSEGRQHLSPMSSMKQLCILT